MSHKSYYGQQAVKVRIGKRVKTLYFASKAEADDYRAYRSALQGIDRGFFHRQRQIAREIDKESKLLQEIIRQSLMCKGFVRRGGSWHLVARLNTPMTLIERAEVRRIRRNAKEVSLPTNWPQPAL